jgi:hypothetical protein
MVIHGALNCQDSIAGTEHRRAVIILRIDEMTRMVRRKLLIPFLDDSST